MWIHSVAVPVPTLALAVSIAALVVYTHRSNLARLRRGEEPKFRGAGNAED